MSCFYFRCNDVTKNKLWLKSNEQNKSKINQMHAKLLQLFCSNTTAESQVHFLQTAVDLLNFLEVEILTNTEDTFTAHSRLAVFVGVEQDSV